MKLVKKTVKSGTGEKKPKTKNHFGFELKTGEDGYLTIKSIVQDLRAAGYTVNDRLLIGAIATELNDDFEDAVKTIDASLESVVEFVRSKGADEISELVIGE